MKQFLIQLENVDLHEHVMLPINVHHARETKFQVQSKLCRHSNKMGQISQQRCSSWQHFISDVSRYQTQFQSDLGYARVSPRERLYSQR